MKIEWVSVGTVLPYDKNPRRNAAAVRKVANSLREYGWRQPIVVDEAMVVLAGHTRLLAAKELGMDTVPVHVAEGLTPAQARAYRLADNRVAQEAEWDVELLAGELSGLQIDGFDLALTGFNADEVAGLLAQAVATVDGATDADDVPPPPPEPCSRLGDVWTLGSHRLTCGSAEDAEAWERLMAGTLADCVWTDPPYGVDYEAKNDHLKAWDGRLERPSHAKEVQNDALDEAALESLLRGALGLAWAHCREGATWYVAGPEGPRQMPFSRVLVELEVWRHTLVWVKDAFVIGRADYHYRHEPLWYGWKPGAAHYFTNDRSLDSVFEIPRPKRSELHPTMKPVELVQRCVEHGSKLGAVVVDPFGGSGTTLMAAERSGRCARLIEVDPRYVDVIVQRWCEFTGKQATGVGAAGEPLAFYNGRWSRGE